MFEKVLNKTFKKHLMYVLLGVLCGFVAVIFVYAIDLVESYTLNLIAHYYPPKPAGEGYREAFTFYPERFYLLPLLTALAGLISGILTTFLSPESAGVGTDSAIKAYHEEKRLSFLSSVVKLITSSFTIGMGGTSGREGPIALIGAGIGSTLSSLLQLPKEEGRVMLGVGLGAGISAIFKAPLAGALISAEVFFKKDFDIENLIPAFLACISSYITVGFFLGFEPIFSVHIPEGVNLKASALFAYFFFGLFCAIFVRLFILLFFRVKALFEELKIKHYLKPVIGGFMAGIVGILSPFAIGNGYGYLQLILDLKLTDPLLILAGAIGVALGVSFTLGSGMSGGIFGPSVMIGGLFGAFYSLLLNGYFGLDLHVPSFTVVGMVTFFGASAKAPLSTLILISEMTGEYSLLVPAMLSIFTAYLLSGDRSIFPSQVNTRLDSVAYREEWGLLKLEKLKVKDYMAEAITLQAHQPVEEAKRLMQEHLISGLVVLEGGRLVGILTKSDLSKEGKTVRDLMSVNVITVKPEESLANALRLMLTKGIGHLPVVKEEKLLGIITREDIARAVRELK